MGGLPLGLQGEEALRRGDRGGRIAIVEQPGQEPVRGVDRQRVQAGALEVEPVVEGRIADREAVQQRPLVEFARPVQLAVAAVLRQPLERQRIDRDRRRVEGDALALGLDHRRAVRRQAVAQ